MPDEEKKRDEYEKRRGFFFLLLGNSSRQLVNRKKNCPLEALIFVAVAVARGGGELEAATVVSCSQTSVEYRRVFNNVLPFFLFVCVVSLPPLLFLFFFLFFFFSLARETSRLRKIAPNSSSRRVSGGGVSVSPFCVCVFFFSLFLAENPSWRPVAIR